MKAKLYLGLFLLVMSHQTLKAQWSRNAATGTVSLTTASDIVKIGNDVGAGTFFANSFKLRANGALGAVSYWDLDDEDFFLDPSGTSELNDMRANIFRDRLNPAYYLDPASNSHLNQLSIDGFINLDFSKSIIFGDPMLAGYGIITAGFGALPRLHILAPGWDATGSAGGSDIFLEAGGSAEEKGGNIVIDPGIGTTMGAIYLSAGLNGVYADVGVGYSRTTTLQAKLDVNGSVRASSYITVSDGTLKEGTNTINSGLEKILSLRGVQYRFKKREGLQLPQGQQTGFIAQEVEQILPDAVFTDASGLKGVDYNKIIPVLVEAIKEQQGQISKLKDQLESLKISDSKSVSSDNRLYQNIPNPSNKNTLIKFDLADDAINSMIVIYDMQGKQIKRISVDRKNTSLEINSGELTPGIYLYSLVTNGVEIDTKRMVITD